MTSADGILSPKLHARCADEDIRRIIAYADPLASADKLPDIEPEYIGNLLQIAHVHRLLPIVARNLRLNTPTARAEILDAVQQDLVIGIGMSMQLDGQARRIAQAFAADGVDATLVKGPVFASRIYPFAADRPFTDVDLVVPSAQLPAACAVLAKLGYILHQKRWFDQSSRNQEYKWGVAEFPYLLIELHGNLVHYPGLRRTVSFGYRELMLAGDGDPAAPLALLMTAIVHAAYGHKFHRLHFVVDILQAFRALSDADKAALPARARALGLAFDTASALDLTGRLFAEPDAVALARTVCETPVTRIARRLLTASAVINAGSTEGRASWFARRSYRLLQIAFAG